MIDLLILPKRPVLKRNPFPSKVIIIKKNQVVCYLMKNKLSDLEIIILNDDSFQKYLFALSLIFKFRTLLSESILQTLFLKLILKFKVTIRLKIYF